MVTVTLDDTPLDDAAAVAAVVDPLDLSYEKRRLYDRRLVFAWHANSDVWLYPFRQAGALRRLVIRGLDESEARLLRWQFAERSRYAGLKLSLDDVQQLAAEIEESREARRYAETFANFLRDARNLREGPNGTLLDRNGEELTATLRAADVEVLRAVRRLLPATVFRPDQLDMRPPEDRADISAALCPTCGGSTQPVKRQSHKTRADLLKRLDAHNDGYPREAFDAWVDARLAPGGPSLSSVLFDDYAQWVHNYGGNREARRESRATVLTQNKWGRLMVARFARATRSAGGKRYAVRLLPA